MQTPRVSGAQGIERVETVSNDGKLLAAIAAACLIVSTGPKDISSARKLAAQLHDQFPHRTVEEIEQRLKHMVRRKAKSPRKMDKQQALD